MEAKAGLREGGKKGKRNRPEANTRMIVVSCLACSLVTSTPSPCGNHCDRHDRPVSILGTGVKSERMAYMATRKYEPHQDSYIYMLFP